MATMVIGRRRILHHTHMHPQTHVHTSQPLPSSLPLKMRTRSNPSLVPPSLDIVSFVYSVLVLLIGSAVIILELPHWHSIWHWQTWFSAPTSKVQIGLFLCASVYYVYDMIIIAFTRYVWNVRDIALICHQLVSVFRLLGPVVTGVDGTIVLVAYFITEVASPPLLLSRICSRMGDRKHPSFIKLSWFEDGKRQKVIEFLHLAHLILFIISRFACVHFAAHVVFPYAKSILTKASALTLVCLSTLAMWEYVIYKGPSH